MTWSVRPTSARSDAHREDAEPPPGDLGAEIPGVATTQAVIPDSQSATSAMGLVVGVVVVALALAIVKPWASIDPVRPASETRAVVQPRPEAASGVVPPTDTDRAIASEMCLEPKGWRLFAAERWPDRVARRWVHVIPVAGASGPADPRIPLISEPSLAVLSVGYCAPVSGPERPPSAVSTTIYRLRHGSAADDPLAWDVIRPPRVLPTRDESSLGGAWASPGSTAASMTGWADATIVLRIAAARPGAEDYTRWFGAVIDVGSATTD
jgi:hypothetical protein